MSNRLRPGVALATILLTGGVAAAQPDPSPPEEPPPAGDPPPVEDDEIVDLPIIPADEPTPVAEAPAGSGPPVLFTSYDKGIVFDSANKQFQARLALRTQFRFEANRSLADGAETEAVFYVPRARLQLEGHIFGKATRYKLEAGLGDGGSYAFAKDVYFDQAVGPVWLRVGQWKRPFYRQEIVSDFGSTFNERAITAGFVGSGRDLGLAIHNNYEKSPAGLEWVVGVFNGFAGGADRPAQSVDCEQDPVTLVIDCAVGRPRTFPDDFGPTAVVRVAWNHGDVKGYTEGDLAGGPLRFSVGASYKIDLANLKQGTAESRLDNMSHGVELDGVVKVAGFDASVGLYLMKLQTADALKGLFLQAGYFAIPKKLLVGVRFAGHETADPDTNLIEGRLAVNWHVEGHAYKLATDWGFTKLTGEVNDADLQARIMAQLTF